MKTLITILSLLAVSAVLTFILNGSWWHVFLYAFLFGVFYVSGIDLGIKMEQKHRGTVIDIFLKNGWS